MKKMFPRSAAKVLAAAAILTSGALLLSGCATGSSASGSGSVPAADVLEKTDGVTTISFWHSMDGKNAQSLTELIDQFNSENEGKIKVEPVFQGDYDNTISKFKASVQSKSTPSMVQIYDIGTQFMIDSQQTIAAQDFIDRDKNDDLGDLQPNIAGYYTVNDKLHSVPFNVSMPVLYYNKTATDAAGVNPDSLATLDGLSAAATKLTRANGGINDFGYASRTYGWYVEQSIAAGDELYCGPDNGRGSERANEFTFANKASEKFIDTMKDMIGAGTAANLGLESDPAKKAFSAGTAAMTIESSGSLTSLTSAASFEVGVSPLPKIEKNDSGPIIGGASLWINAAGHSDAEQEAAWQFSKFLSTPASQAKWFAESGYIPTTKSALDEKVAKDIIEQKPQFAVIIKQLEDTKVTAATQGCAAGIMPQARKGLEEAMEKAILGSDTKKTLEDAAKSLTSDLETYNSSVTK